MAITVTHAKVAVIPDDGTSEVGSDEWNAAHALSGTLAAAQMPALTGDVTTPGASLATTLATVNGNVGTFGSATTAPVVTVNAKGLVTAVSSTTMRERLSADRDYYVCALIGTVTYTVGVNPTFTRNSHGLSAGDYVRFSSTGANDAGIGDGYPWEVQAAGLAANTFKLYDIGTTNPPTTASAGTGTHSLWTGDDDSTGLTSSRADAVFTIQAAVDIVANTLDLNNQDVTINCNGAFGENVILKTYLGSTKTVDANWHFLTGVKILGNRSSLVVIQPTDGVHNCFSAVDNKTPWIIDGFAISRGYSGFFDAIHQAGGTPVYIGKVDFGDFTNGQHMFGDIRTTESYSISGGSATHRAAWQGDSLYVDSPNYTAITCTITNSPTFSTAFYNVEFAQMDCYGVTFSGAVTNTKRMNAIGNGFINTYGIGETYCPGAIAATTATGGVIG